MQLTSALFIVFLQLKLQLSDCLLQRSNWADLSTAGVVTFALKRGSFTSPKVPYSRIDGRSIKDGSLIEYVSAKGSKRLAIVSKRKGENLEVLNNVMIEFLVPVSKVTHLINGFHTYDDLIKLTSTISMYKQDQVLTLWDSTIGQTDNRMNMEFVSQNVFGTTRAIDMFASMKLMKQFGKIFFEEFAPAVQDDDDIENSPRSEISYKPLSLAVVQANLKHQEALQVFRSEFTRMMTTQAPKSGDAHSTTEMNKDVVHILNEYIEGLKQIVAKVHPWVVNGWSTNTIDAEAAVKGVELLEYLELSPTSKNARKVLEMSGVWNVHTDIERYVMAIRDAFPAEVLEEAKNLLENMENIPDPDGSIRKDLRHLACYAIDSEGAAEVRFLSEYYVVMYECGRDSH